MEWIGYFVLGMGTIISAVTYGFLRPNQRRQNAKADRVQQNTIRKILLSSSNKTCTLKTIKEQMRQSDTQQIRTHLRAIGARSIKGQGPEKWTLK